MLIFDIVIKYVSIKSGDDPRLPEGIRTLTEARKKARETLQTKPLDTEPEVLEPEELFIRGVKNVLEDVALGHTPKIIAFAIPPSG